jgi:hypothetical protein
MLNHADIMALDTAWRPPFIQIVDQDHDLIGNVGKARDGSPQLWDELFEHRIGNSTAHLIAVLGLTHSGDHTVDCRSESGGEVTCNDVSRERERCLDIPQSLVPFQVRLHVA